MSEDKVATTLNLPERINYWTEKLLSQNNKHNITIAFAVTDVSDTVKIDDYIKAEALSIEFKKYGWNIVFLNRLKRQWYELDRTIDILITFNDLYDLSRVESLNTNLIKVAWASRWYQEWKSLSYLDQYLFIFSTNEESVTSLQKISDNSLFHLSLDIEAKDYKSIAQQIKQEFINRLTKPTISLKIPAKTWNRINSWGDYHFAVLLKQQLDLKGFFTYLHVQSEWYGTSSENCDINFVLRGLRKHIVNNNQINIMWNISHPDSITMDEYEDYDHIYIASSFWAKQIASKTKVLVEPLLQCTDTQRFYPPSSTELKKYRNQLLFVGNSRGIFRPILKDLLPTEYDLAIFGEHPTEKIPDVYLIDDYLPNEELYKYYGSADILLNDHWGDMKEKGFISNRIYDGLASGAFIISDGVKHMEELDEYIVTYKSKKELKQHLEYYLSNPHQRKIIASKGYDFIKNNHTFKQRAENISLRILKLINEKYK